MSRIEELVEDYSRHQVPDQKTVSGLRIALIVIGVAITVPAFVVGSELGIAQGAKRAMVAFFVGGACLAVIASLVGTVGARTRYSTAMIIRSTFGRQGAVLVNLVMGIVWLGWYAVIAAFFGEALATGFETFGWWPISANTGTVIGSVLMLIVTLFGFKALDKLSLAAVPVMVAFLVLVVHYATAEQGIAAVFDQAVDSPQGMGATASMVVGTFIVGCTMFPDLCRYARGASHAVFGGVAAFAVGFPLVLTFAALPSIATGEADLMKVIAALGLAVSGVLMLVFATWTTNSYNLYSATLALAPVLKNLERWLIVVLVTVAGTVIAMLGVLDLFMQWVGFLAVTIPPIAGVYIVDFLVFDRHALDMGDSEAKGIHWPAFAAWIVGVVVANLANLEYVHLTAIPAIDAILTAMLVYFVLRKTVSA